MAKGSVIYIITLGQWDGRTGDESAAAKYSRRSLHCQHNGQGRMGSLLALRVRGGRARGCPQAGFRQQPGWVPVAKQRRALPRPDTECKMVRRRERACVVNGEDSSIFKFGESFDRGRPGVAMGHCGRELEALLPVSTNSVGDNSSTHTNPCPPSSVYTAHETIHTMCHFIGLGLIKCMRSARRRGVRL